MTVHIIPSRPQTYFISDKEVIREMVKYGQTCVTRALNIITSAMEELDENATIPLSTGVQEELRTQIIQDFQAHHERKAELFRALEPYDMNPLPYDLPLPVFKTSPEDNVPGNQSEKLLEFFENKDVVEKSTIAQKALEQIATGSQLYKVKMAPASP